LRRIIDDEPSGSLRKLVMVDEKKGIGKKREFRRNNEY
jgi:hypothetical protein